MSVNLSDAELAEASKCRRTVSVCAPSKRCKAGTLRLLPLKLTPIGALTVILDSSDLRLVDDEGASIVLNGSVHAVMGVPGWSAYAATKAGVRAMTRNLASESLRAASALIRSRRVEPERPSGRHLRLRKKPW